jgi:hypothetical protein
LDELPQRRPRDPFSFLPNVLRARNVATTRFDKQSIAALPSEKAPIKRPHLNGIARFKKVSWSFAANSGDSKMQASHKMWRQRLFLE